LAGNEAHGLPAEVLTLVDDILAIPMTGYKLSLNVGVAAAITAMEFRRRATYCE
jgi:tRNA G18 (ribose-2'-O)-methylase SpoU